MNECGNVCSFGNCGVFAVHKKKRRRSGESSIAVAAIAPTIAPAWNPHRVTRYID
jgi:hypothetical protein